MRATGVSSLLVLLVVAAAAVARAQEVLSDLVTSPQDEARALEIKAERFWGSFLRSAQELQLEEHVQLLADTGRVIQELPPENEYVREALEEAARHLRSASDALLAQAARTSQAAGDGLARKDRSEWIGSSLLTGSGHLDVFSRAIRRFVGGGTYSEQLLSSVQSRQADILPSLRGASEVTGTVLSDCHAAQRGGFDVLKYDLYHKGVPKTPESAKDVANRIIDASSSMHRRFTSFIGQAASSIAGDFQGKDDPAVATVVQASVGELARWGELESPVPPTKALPMSLGQRTGLGARPRAGLASV